MAEPNDKPTASGPAEKASNGAAVGPDPLEDLRTAIGEVDAALVDLLNRRAALSRAARLFTNPPRPPPRRLSSRLSHTEKPLIRPSPSLSSGR